MVKSKNVAPRLSPRDASALLEQHCPKPRGDAVPLAAAWHRLLAEDVRADSDQPRFDRVCMDGIAFRFLTEQPRSWRDAGLQLAGKPPLSLPDAASAFEVTTGAVCPDGCDTVIRYEDLERDADTWRLIPSASYRFRQNIQARGSEYRMGDLLLEKGTFLRAPELAILAALGQSRVRVYARPRVHVISNGHELVSIEQQPLPHQIRDSNSTAIQACLASFGFDQLTLHRADDDEASLTSILHQALEHADCVILSAGVSRGPKDLVPQVLQSLGVREVFYEIEQKPGKPFWFGLTASGQLVFGLPGNPVATLMNLRRYVLPTLAQWEGHFLGPKWVLLAEDCEGGTIERMVPVRLEGGSPAHLRARLKPTQGSGDFASLRGTDGFVCLPPIQDRWREGTALAFFDWSPLYG